MEGAGIWAVAAPEDPTSGADGKGSGAVERANGAVVMVGSGSDGMGGGEDITLRANGPGPGSGQHLGFWTAGALG